MELLIDQIKDEMIEQKLREKIKEIVNGIDERLDWIHEQRTKYCKVKSEWDIKISKEYEHLLEFKRRCTFIDDVKKITVEEYENIKKMLGLYIS